MKVLEFIFYIWLILSGVYVVFRIKDFFSFWKGTIDKLYEVIVEWIRKR